MLAIGYPLSSRASPALGLVPSVPGIHLSACSCARGWLDPGDKHRDDTKPVDANAGTLFDGVHP